MTDNGNHTTPNGNGKKPAPKVLRVTSPQEWRKLRQQGVMIELPSGFVARLRPVSLIDLWGAGKIPPTLTGLVASLLETSGKSDLPTNDNMLKALSDLYSIICKSAFLEPSVVDNPSDNSDDISMEDIPQVDREFVLNWAQNPSAELRRFRDEQTADVVTVPTGEGIQSSTE